MTEENEAKFIRQLSACAFGQRSSYVILNKRDLEYYWLMNHGTKSVYYLVEPW